MPAAKRTLYEVFSDKESLLKECILKAQADRDKYLQKVFEQSHNVLEVILAVFQKSGFVPQKSGFDQNCIAGEGADTYFCTALVKTNQSL